MQKLYSKKTHVERKKKRELKKNRTRTEEEAEQIPPNGSKTSQNNLHAV